MSRYGELSILAVNESTKIGDSRRKCGRALIVLLNGLSEFLEAPDGAILFAHLDRELNCTGETSSSEPNLILDHEGTWNVGLGFHFGDIEVSNTAMTVLGVNIAFDGHKIEVIGKREFEIDNEDRSSFLPIFQYFFDLLKNEFSGPFGQRRRKIGF